MKYKKKSLLDEEDFMVSPLDGEDLMVYELDYTEKRIKLDIKPDELQNYLNPERVLIIIRKDLHKIYIWKGSKSPVRKRFNSNRVAFDIRQDLEDRDYKIIPIDRLNCELCGIEGSSREMMPYFYKSHPRDILGPRILSHPNKYLCKDCARSERITRAYL